MYAFAKYQAAQWPLGECQNLAPLIDDKLMRKEVGLNATRWFDYRSMHPVKLTDLFYAILQEENVRYTDQNIDRFEANCMGKGNCAFDQTKRVLQPIVKARHMADQFGIPYRFFIRSIQDLHAEMDFTGKLPPVSYYYRTNMGEALIAAFKDAAVTRRYSAETDHYLAENYVGRQEQEQYIDWMTSVCRLSEQPKKLLSFYINDRKQFPVDMIEAQFGKGFLEEPNNLQKEGCVSAMSGLST